MAPFNIVSFGVEGLIRRGRGGSYIKVGANLSIYGNTSQAQKKAFKTNHDRIRIFP